MRAYALIGFSPDRDYAYLEVNKSLRRMHPELVQRVESEIMALGAEIERDNATDLLRINDEFSASLILAHRPDSRTATQARNAGRHLASGTRHGSGDHGAGGAAGHGANRAPMG